MPPCKPPGTLRCAERLFTLVWAHASSACWAAASVLSSGVPGRLEAKRQEPMDQERLHGDLAPRDPQIRFLRDATLAVLESVARLHALPELIVRRARHGISEDQRTLQAKEALQASDYDQVRCEPHNALVPFLVGGAWSSNS